MSFNLWLVDDEDAPELASCQVGDAPLVGDHCWLHDDGKLKGPWLVVHRDWQLLRRKSDDGLFVTKRLHCDVYVKPCDMFKGKG